MGHRRFGSMFPVPTVADPGVQSAIPSTGPDVSIDDLGDNCLSCVSVSPLDEPLIDSIPSTPTPGSKACNGKSDLTNPILVVDVAHETTCATGGNTFGNSRFYNLSAAYTNGSPYQQDDTNKKRPCDDQPGRARHDERDDDGNKRCRRSSTPPVPPDGQNRKYACHFFKHNPREYRLGKCRGPGWSKIPRLKEHIYRRHRKHICKRCHCVFENQKDLVAHQKQSCEVRLPADPISDKLDGIDEGQYQKLKSRAGLKGKNDKERWEEIYRIIFGDEASMPSPYYEDDDFVDDIDHLTREQLRQHWIKSCHGTLHDQIETHLEPVLSPYCRNMVDWESGETLFMLTKSQVKEVVQSVFDQIVPLQPIGPDEGDVKNNNAFARSAQSDPPVFLSGTSDDRPSECSIDDTGFPGGETRGSGYSSSFPDMLDLPTGDMYHFSGESALYSIPSGVGALVPSELGGDDGLSEAYLPDFSIARRVDWPVSLATESQSQTRELYTASDETVRARAASHFIEHLETHDGDLFDVKPDENLLLSTFHGSTDYDMEDILQAEPGGEDWGVGPLDRF
ncbi:hypothetical protein GQ43DRAFT_433778 [Delitschia confertaspora ATCC 74209]|uniref:C2H2-type domain-containing protein n=1 Tax=Delitschia confertaspora ATCC 74209 TaxID=1513339 RepID=A0A9P4MQI8_9PLEO|nr:hypothetical protein GQ43DRAFT_433778 [Delitschia confertaspora ATCC 74209]